MSRFLTRSLGVLAASLTIALVSGCSAEEAGCSHGAESPETALRGLLEAAQNSDVESMRAHVFPSLSVTEVDLIDVGLTLNGETVSDTMLWRSEPLHDHFVVRVHDSQDQLLGEWEVGALEEPHGGCYAVSWGEPPAEGPSPTPSTLES